MSDITLIFTILSTSVTTIFAIVQLYIKIKQALKDAVREIVGLELNNLKNEIEELKVNQNELSKQIEEIKKKLE